jgi:hypothetical protein
MHATNNDSHGAVGGWLKRLEGTEGVNMFSMQASPNPYYYPGPPSRPRPHDHHNGLPSPIPVESLTHTPPVT